MLSRFQLLAVAARNVLLPEDDPSPGRRGPVSAPPPSGPTADRAARPSSEQEVATEQQRRRAAAQSTWDRAFERLGWNR